MSVSQGGELNAEAIAFAPGATLTPTLATQPTGNSVSVVLVTFGSSSGTPTVNPTLVAFANPQCVELGASQLVTNATALSVKIAVVQKCSSLSTGALAGIIVGCIVLALAIAAAVIGGIMHQRRSQASFTDLRDKINYVAMADR